MDDFAIDHDSVPDARNVRSFGEPEHDPVDGRKCDLEFGEPVRVGKSRRWGNAAGAGLGEGRGLGQGEGCAQGDEEGAARHEDHHSIS